MSGLEEGCKVVPTVVPPGEEKKSQKPPRNPDVELHSSGAIIRFPNGTVMTISECGQVKSLDGEYVSLSRDLSTCIRHIISMNLDAARKKAKAKVEAVEDKVRYVTKNGRRAFAAGLAIGRKT
jgi:hypothetical protein